MRAIRHLRLPHPRLRHVRIPAAALVAALLVAGCGSDSSGEDTAASVPSIPAVTSPVPTAPTGTGGAAAPGKKSKTITGAPASSRGCEVPDSFQRLRFTGTDCATAAAVAGAWNDQVDACNTIDDPESPEGFKRTCTVEDYSCEAKRDVHSDARFVTCTKGGASIRFTFLPG
jgi:hypothetical protein